jgi:hypothetical protein
VDPKSREKSTIFPRDHFGILEIDHDGDCEDYRSVACPTEAEKTPVSIPSNGIEGIRIAQKSGIYESYVGEERESRWRWHWFNSSPFLNQGGERLKLRSYRPSAERKRKSVVPSCLWSESMS